MNKYFRGFIFCLIPICYLVFQLFTIDQYGQTVDSKIIIERGNFYFYEYDKVGYEGIYQAIPSAKLRSYGSLYSTLVAASKHYLYDIFPVFSDPVHAYHFPNILASTFAIFLLGIFIFNIWGFAPSILAMLVLITIPRFFGHAQTNYKDLSTLAFFLPCIITLYYAVVKKNIYYWISAGILIGLCYCVRIHALMVIPIICFWYGVFYLWSQNQAKQSSNKLSREVLNFSLQLILCLIIAIITVIICWPYYRVDPFNKFMEAFNVMSGHEWNFKQLYLGEELRADKMPWHYPLVYLSLTLPVSYLVLLIVGFIFTLVSIVKNYPYKNTLTLISICALTPPIAHVLMGTPMYGGVRHWLLIYPFFAALVAFAQWQLIAYMKLKNVKYYIFSLVIVFIIFTNQIYQNAKLFPLTYIYFNSLIGGEELAQHLFTLDIRLQAKHHVKKWIAEQGGDKKYRVIYSKKFSRKKAEKIFAEQTPIHVYQINGATLAYVYEK